MMSFEELIKNDDDLSLINNTVIETLSKNNSNIKIDFYENHIKLCTKISYELACLKNLNQNML